MSDVDMFELVPFEYALREWRNLPPDERYDTVGAERYVPARMRTQPAALAERTAAPPKRPARQPGECPECGFPRGERGFVRFRFPLGHELFGKLVCCRRCWPWPFGENPEGSLSPRARDIAAAWDRREARRVR